MPLGRVAPLSVLRDSGKLDHTCLPFSTILRIGEGKILRQLEAVAAAVNAIEDDFVAMSDDELRGMTDEFKERLADGESLDDIMPEAFATAREASRRVLGHAAVRRPDHGWRRAAPGQHRRDEDR